MFKSKIRYGIVPVSIVLQALLLVLQIQWLTFAGKDLFTEWMSYDNLYYVFYNVFLYSGLLFLFYVMTRRITPGYVVLGVFGGIFGVINNMKWNSLNECVTLSDFAKISEALKVGGDAEFHVWTGTWCALILFVLSICLWLYMDLYVAKALTGNVSYRKGCGIALIVMSACMIPLVVADGRQSVMAKLTEAVQSEKTGPVVYFVESLFQTKERETYTADEAWKSYEAYVEKGKKIATENKASTTHPNIIVIMSEAFYDVNLFEGAVTYSEDPMSAFREVCKEGMTGNLYVNVYGGSTHFTEFEFLTGWNTRGMGSGSCPYKEYFSDEQPSFAGYLKESGYTTLAIHPYNGKFWNRYVAYPRLGFERFIDQYRMSYQEKCGYISDDSLTNEIIKQYEEKDADKPLFCFSVSIANHIAILNGEEKENAPDDIEVTFDDALGYGPNKKRWVQEYVSGIAKSGEALRKLTEYLKTQDEPTIVVFFGDHAPSYALEQLSVCNRDEKLAYSTPYLIWGNYDWQGEENVEDISASYLSTYVMQLLGMPLVSQNYYNIAMHEEYPVETRYMIKDGTGRFYPEFSKEEQHRYYEHALDLKKHVETLLEHPEITKDIWSVP